MSEAALKRLTRLALSPAYYPGDAVPTTYTRILYEDFQPGARRERLNQQEASGGMGHLSLTAPNQRANRYFVEPRMAFKPCVPEWALLLPWMLNGVVSGSGTYTYQLGQIGSRRTVVFDDTQKVWALTGVQCAAWTLNAQAGGEVSLDIEAAGIGYDDTFATAFPSGGNLTALTQTPDRFLAGDQAIAATGVTDPIRWRSLSLRCDHRLNNDRYFGSFTSAGPINVGPRVITLRLELPWAYSQQLWLAGQGANGVPMTLAFTVGGKSLTFTMPAVVAPAPPVDVQDPELFISWEALCVVHTTAANTGPSYGAESELSAVLDTTA